MLLFARKTKLPTSSKRRASYAPKAPRKTTPCGALFHSGKMTLQPPNLTIQAKRFAIKGINGAILHPKQTRMRFKPLFRYFTRLCSNLMPAGIPAVIFLCGFAHSAQAQGGPLEAYIQEALESNVALAQKNLSYEKSLLALKEARAMFFPTLGLKARYTMAAGGRTFVIPTGDLMNPVFSNLNLINSIGKATDPSYPDLPEYPELQNEEVKFLRSREHETKIEMVFPIFNAAILNNHRLKATMAEMEKISVEVYKRELVKEVKVAYFNYLKAREGVALFQNTLELVEEHLRTTQSLFKHQKITIDGVYAAEAQVKEVELQLSEAQKNQAVAQAYFNFLLNRNYNAPIEPMPPGALESHAISLPHARQMAFQGREELQQLNYALTLADQKINLDKGNYLPSLSLVGDYGFQGENYSFTRDDDFMMGSLVLSWNIFNRPTKYKVEQSKIEREIIVQKKEETWRQIGIQVVQAYYELEAAAKRIELAKAQKEAAQKAFRLVNKKYKQGQANRVEFTDARTRMTNASQQLIIAQYDYQIRLAEFGRAIAK